MIEFCFNFFFVNTFLLECKYISPSVPWLHIHISPDSEIVREALDVTTRLKSEIINIETNWRIKKREDRVQALHAASVASGEEKGSFSHKSKLDENITSENLDECYNSALSREWLMIKNTCTVGNQFLSWVPQCGDKILYNRQLHGKFVNGHFSSLTKDQRILPAILPRRKKMKKSDKEDDEEGKVVVTDGTEKYQYWLGTILWIRACFPPLVAPEFKSFDTDAPILAIGIKFHYQWLSRHTHVVHWRPCQLDSVNGLAMGSEEGETCRSCGLSLNNSFIVPAWVGPMDKILPPYPISLLKQMSVPTGLPLGTKNRIHRCMESVRQRILREVDVDSFTPNEKYKIPTDLQDIPTKFHHIFKEKDNDGGNAQLKESSGNMDAQDIVSEENVNKLLSRNSFLPPWAISSNDEKKVTTRATKSNVDCIEMHETLMANPYLCLEMINDRIKDGYYRDLIAAAHDVREAFVNSAIYILKESIKTKQIDEKTAKKIVLLVVESSVKVDQTMCNGDQNLRIKSADYSNLQKREIQLIERIATMRKVHAVALMCILESIITEIALGLDAIEDGVDVVGPDEDQIKLKKTLGKILSSLSQDRCSFRKPLDKTSPLPTMQVKIIPPATKAFSSHRCHTSAKPAANKDVSSFTSKPIVFTPNDYENNSTLVSALFCPSIKRSIDVKVTMEALKNKRKTTTGSITLDPDHYMNDPSLLKALFCPPVRRSISVNVRLDASNLEVVENEREDEDTKILNTKLPDPSEHSSLKEADDDTDTEVDFKKMILYQPDDYQDNDELLRALFCKPKRTNVCARCKVGRNSLLSCRVRKAHSNLDFVWTEFLINVGGVDGILQQLKPPSAQAGHLEKVGDKKIISNEHQGSDITTQNPNDRPVTKDATSEQIEARVNVEIAPQKVPESSELQDKASKDEKEEKENSSGSNDVPPLELLLQAEEFLRRAQHCLLVAKDDFNSKPCLSEEFLKSNDLLDPDDGHYEICVYCGLGGDVLCCESCPIVSHAKCVGLAQIPNGDWYCKRCTEKSHTQSQDKPQNEKIEEKTERPDMQKLEASLEEFRTNRQKDKGGSKKDDKPDEDRTPSKKKNISEEKMQERDDLHERDEEIAEKLSPITVGMKFVKRSLFELIGEIISLPNRDTTFYEVRYEDGEVEKLELDEIKEGISLYNNLGGTGAFSDRRRRTRRQPMRYGVEAPKQPKTRKRPNSFVGTSLMSSEGKQNEPRKKKLKTSGSPSKDTPKTGMKRGRQRKAQQINTEIKATVSKKRGLSNRAKKQSSNTSHLTFENLQWSPRAGFVDPSMTYYCTVENDTSATIARKVGVEWSDVANEPENSIRFPALQNKRTRFRKGTLVRIPVDYELKRVIRLKE